MQTVAPLSEIHQRLRQNGGRRVRSLAGTPADLRERIVWYELQSMSVGQYWPLYRFNPAVYQPVPFCSELAAELDQLPSYYGFLATAANPAVRIWYLRLVDSYKIWSSKEIPAAVITTATGISVAGPGYTQIELDDFTLVQKLTAALAEWIMETAPPPPTAEEQLAMLERLSRL
jgi:hypothetical protein